MIFAKLSRIRLCKIDKTARLCYNGRGIKPREIFYDKSHYF